MGLPDLKKICIEGILLHFNGNSASSFRGHVMVDNIMLTEMVTASNEKGNNERLGCRCDTGACGCQCVW